MTRICPKRDAICPHGMDCPYAVGRYTCKPEPEATVATYVELPDDASSADVAEAFAGLLNKQS